MKNFRPNLISIAVAACVAQMSNGVMANPQGEQVMHGSAQFQRNGNVLTVTNTPNAIINWSQFNIGAGETTRFIQQSANSNVLNRVVGADPSQIHGTLQSNGNVFLINPQGIVFGPNAFVDVNKLVASTLNLSDSNFLNGKFSFNGGGFGGLLNQGRISTPLGGSVYLIGTDVRNEGVITSPQGQITLAAGNQVELVDSAGPEVSVTISAAGNRAVNLGTVKASGGRINMFGALIDQQGVLSADSASVNEKGVIVLRASESVNVAGTVSAVNSAGTGGDVRVLSEGSVTLASTALIDASGSTGGGTVMVGGSERGQDTTIVNANSLIMAQGAVVKADALENGDGGRVILYSAGRTEFGGSVFARGGAQSGNGGFVETSGRSLSLGGTVNTSAANGQAGTWLIDPRRICIFATSSSECFAGTSIFNRSASDSRGPTFLSSDLLIDARSIQPTDSTGNIQVIADELIAVLPAGGAMSVATTTGSNFTLRAPVIHMNGTLSATSGNLTLDTSFPGSTFSVADIGNLPALISLGSSAKIVGGTGLSGTSGLTVLFGTEHLVAENGARIELARRPLANVMNNLSSVDINFRSTSNSGGNQIINNGAFIQTDNLTIYAPLAAASAVRPLNVDVNYVTYTFVLPSDSATATQVRVGGNNCNSTIQTPCLNGNFSAFITGTIQQELGITFEYALQSGLGPFPAINLVGDISSVAAIVAPYGENIFISSPLNFAGNGLLLQGGHSIVVDAAINAPNGSVRLEGGNISVNAPITARDTLFLTPLIFGTPPTSTGFLNVNANLTADHVSLAAGDVAQTTAIPTTITIGQGVVLRSPGSRNVTQYLETINEFGVFETAISGILVEPGPNVSLINNAGTGVFVAQGASNGWIIAIPPASQSPNATISLGGVDMTGLVSLITAQRFGELICGNDANCIQLEQSPRGDFRILRAASDGTAPAVILPPATNPTAPISSDSGNSLSTTGITDICVQNPLLCATPSSSGNVYRTDGQTASVSGLNRVDTSIIDAPLRVAAELTVMDDDRVAVLTKPSASEGKAESAALRRNASPEAKAIAKEAGDLKSQAKAAREDAKRAEGAVKEADKQAARAEEDVTERRAEARKAEAEVRKAESEVKSAKTPEEKAEAQRKFEEKRSELAQKTEKVEESRIQAITKRSEAEAAKAEVESRRAEADKLETKAEARMLAAEARDMKVPGNRQVAEKRAEVRDVEADVKGAVAEVKKAEADVRRVEAKEQKAETEVRQLREALKAEREVAKAEQKVEREVAKAEQKVERGAEKVDQKIERQIAKAEEKLERQASKVEEKLDRQAEKTEKTGEKLERTLAKAEEKAERTIARLEEKVEREVSKTEERLAAAERKLAEVKTEAAQVKAKVEEAKTVVETRKADVERKVTELKVQETKRVEERRSEMAQMFSKMTPARMDRAAMENMMSMRQELKTEALTPALNVLNKRPAAADLPRCGGAEVVCIPDGPSQTARSFAPQTPTVSFLPQIQRKVALMIGVNSYSDPDVPSLETALPDAQAVGRQLEDQFGYSVKTLPNASRSDIVQSLNRLAEEVGPNDSVTIYYAGHGYLNDKTGTGYWIPSDAKATSPAQWISNNDISKLLNNIPAKQVLLVSDSCYSGSLTKEQLAGANSLSNPGAILEKRSVTVMSSGGEEPVSDEGKDGHSIFAYSFMKALKSVDKFDAASKVFTSVRSEVTKDFPQEPQYGGVVSANHQAGGEFLLEVRSYK